MDPTSVHSVTSQASRASALAGASSTTLRSASSSADGEAVVDVAANLAEVRGKIDAKVEECNRPKGSVKLVAVSKTKPMELLMDAYNVSLRCSWLRL